MCAGKRDKNHIKPVNSHGLVNRAGEVLGAEAGEKGWGYVRQEGHQFDLEPELDEVRILQMFLCQRCRLFLTEDLIKVRCQLSEVLQEEHGKEKLVLVQHT